MLRPNPNPRYVSPRLTPANVKWISELLPALSSEIGGAIELNRDGKFERYTVYTSSKRLAMILPDFLCVEWHAHFDPYAVQLPSLTDLKIAMKRKMGYKQGNPGVTGQVNVVFCRKGVVVYRFKGSRLHSNSTFELINGILNDGVDTVSGMKDQIRRIERISKFELRLTPWSTALSRGVSLGRLCLNEIVTDPKVE